MRGDDPLVNAVVRATWPITTADRMALLDEVIRGDDYIVRGMRLSAVTAAVCAVLATTGVTAWWPYAVLVVCFSLAEGSAITGFLIRHRVRQRLGAITDRPQAESAEL